MVHTRKPARQLPTCAAYLRVKSEDGRGVRRWPEEPSQRPPAPAPRPAAPPGASSQVRSIACRRRRQGPAGTAGTHRRWKAPGRHARLAALNDQSSAARTKSAESFRACPR